MNIIRRNPSGYLVVLIATHNRLDLLKNTIRSVIEGTTVPIEIIVIDGGSDDGTVQYLKDHPIVSYFLQGERVGTARAYNSVWKLIDSKYTCWLSDDTEIVPGSLDSAVAILESESNIGMVGLKMKDTIGPYANEDYMGGISRYGILNCNHGMLPTKLLRTIGYFNEEYRSYMIDPDLTASVLSVGKKVVMTKKVSILHHREWAVHEGKERMIREMAGIDNFEIYRVKFRYLADPGQRSCIRRSVYLTVVKNLLFLLPFIRSSYRNLNYRDWYNLKKARFISAKDSQLTESETYYLVQSIPEDLLSRPNNPYAAALKEDRMIQIKRPEEEFISCASS